MARLSRQTPRQTLQNPPRLRHRPNPPTIVRFFVLHRLVVGMLTAFLMLVSIRQQKRRQIFFLPPLCLTRRIGGLASRVRPLCANICTRVRLASRLYLFRYASPARPLVLFHYLTGKGVGFVTTKDIDLTVTEDFIGFV